MKTSRIALCAAMFMALAIMAAPLSALAGTYKKKSDCVKVVKSDWKVCGGDEAKPIQALTLTLDNQCIDAMYIKICIEKEGGEQDCRPLEKIEKGATMEAETCDASGKYSIDACEEKRYCPE